LRAPVRPGARIGQHTQLPCSETVLLLVDFINPMDFPGAKHLARRAVAAARATARLKARRTWQRSRLSTGLFDGLPGRFARRGGRFTVCEAHRGGDGLGEVQWQRVAPLRLSTVLWRCKVRQANHLSLR